MSLCPSSGECNNRWGDCSSGSGLERAVAGVQSKRRGNPSRAETRQHKQGQKQCQTGRSCTKSIEQRGQETGDVTDGEACGMAEGGDQAAQRKERKRGDSCPNKPERSGCTRRWNKQSGSGSGSGSGRKKNSSGDDLALEGHAHILDRHGALLEVGLLALVELCQMGANRHARKLFLAWEPPLDVVLLADRPQLKIVLSI